MSETFWGFGDTAIIDVYDRRPCYVTVLQPLGEDRVMVEPILERWEMRPVPLSALRPLTDDDMAALREAHFRATRGEPTP